MHNIWHYVLISFHILDPTGHLLKIFRPLKQSTRTNSVQNLMPNNLWTKLNAVQTFRRRASWVRGYSTSTQNPGSFATTKSKGGRWISGELFRQDNFYMYFEREPPNLQEIILYIWVLFFKVSFSTLKDHYQVQRMSWSELYWMMDFCLYGIYGIIDYLERTLGGLRLRIL